MNRMVAVVLVVGAIVVASAGSSHARSNGGHGPGGDRRGAPVARQHGFQRHPSFQRPPAVQGHHGFGAQREFRRGGHGRGFVGVAPFFVGPAYTYGWAYAPGNVYAPPVDVAPPPSYWYYCPSVGAYYPDVPACPEPWVPVPTQ
jgi:hypothetical protein